MKNLPFKVGDEIKNYKEMCALLNEEVRAGNSKISQLNRWRDYFEWENEGYKFIITKVLNVQYPTHDDNTIGKSLKEYNEYIQMLILNALYYFQKENSLEVSLNISPKGLVKIINLFNDYFHKLSFDKRFRKKIASELGVKEELLRDFHSRLNSMAKSDVHSALKQLQRKGIIYVNETILVKPSHPFELGLSARKVMEMENFFIESEHESLTNKFTSAYGVISEKDFHKNQTSVGKSYYYIPRVATDFEQSALLLCQDIALKNLKLKNKQHAYAIDRTEELQMEMTKLTQDYVGIHHFYKGYQIIFSKPILNQNSLLNSFQLSENMVLTLEEKLTEEFQEVAKNNYLKRYQKGKTDIQNATTVTFDTLDSEHFVGDLCHIKQVPHTSKTLNSISDEQELNILLNHLFKLGLK